MRPEDKDARQDQRAFATGATLDELEQYIAYLRSLGAPGDAHPKVGVSDDYEVTMMICVVERLHPTARGPAGGNRCAARPDRHPGRKPDSRHHRSHR